MKNFFAGPTIVTTFAVSLALIMSLNSSWASSPNDIKTPAETSIDLYSDISARNLDGVLQLIPAEGFTEIGVGEGETHRLDKQLLKVSSKPT
jgi:hypothetical protein